MARKGVAAYDATGPFIGCRARRAAARQTCGFPGGIFLRRRASGQDSDLEWRAVVGVRHAVPSDLQFCNMKRDGIERARVKE